MMDHIPFDKVPAPNDKTKANLERLKLRLRQKIAERIENGTNEPVSSRDESTGSSVHTSDRG